MSDYTELSIKQQFSIRSFEEQVKLMTREQAQEFLIKMFEEMTIREAMYRGFLKHQWGLGDSPSGKAEGDR